MSSGLANSHGEKPTSSSGAAARATVSMTSRTRAMLQAPPHWTSRIPEGRNAAANGRHRRSWSVTQCSAAVETITSTGSASSSSSTSWHHTSAWSPSRARASCTMSREASIASTRPAGTSASSASVTRPVPQPTSRIVALGGIPASRNSTSCAHACCGVLETSYARASQGVLIARSSDLYGPRGQCQEWAPPCSRARLSAVQECWKLRSRMNLKSGSARCVARVCCLYTRKRKRGPRSIARARCDHRRADPGCWAVRVRDRVGTRRTLRRARRSSFRRTRGGLPGFWIPGAADRPGQGTAGTVLVCDVASLVGFADVCEHLGRCAVDLALAGEVNHPGNSLVPSPGRYSRSPDGAAYRLTAHRDLVVPAQRWAWIASRVPGSFLVRPRVRVVAGAARCGPVDVRWLPSLVPEAGRSPRCDFA